MVALHTALSRERDGRQIHPVERTNVNAVWGTLRYIVLATCRLEDVACGGGGGLRDCRGPEAAHGRMDCVAKAPSSVVGVWGGAGAQRRGGQGRGNGLSNLSARCAVGSVVETVCYEAE